MKKILIVGAGFLQTYIIRMAKELGYYTIAIDGNSMAEGLSIADEYEVINIVDEKACYEFALHKGIDGVLTVATDYGVLTASYIAERLNLPGLKYNTAKLIKNKYKVRKRLFETQVDDTMLVHEVEKMSDITYLENHLCYPVMVKPSDGSGSRGTSKVSDFYQLNEACSFAIKNSLNQKATIESYIEGQEYGVESFIYNGNVYIMAIMRKWMTTEPYYAELGHSIPSGLDKHIENKIINYVKKAIYALDINFGAVNMDLIISKSNEIHIIDIGARMGGNLIGSHIIPIGTGIDYMKGLIRATVRDNFSFIKKNPKKNIVTRLLALSPGIIEYLPNFTDIENTYNVKIFHHLSIGNCINEYHTNLDGYGYIVAIGDNYNNAINNACGALLCLDKSIKRR